MAGGQPSGIPCGPASCPTASSICSTASDSRASAPHERSGSPYPPHVRGRTPAHKFSPHRSPLRSAQTAVSRSAGASGSPAWPARLPWKGQIRQQHLCLLTLIIAQALRPRPAEYAHMVLRLPARKSLPVRILRNVLSVSPPTLWKNSRSDISRALLRSIPGGIISSAFTGSSIVVRSCMAVIVVGLPCFAVENQIAGFSAAAPSHRISLSDALGSHTSHALRPRLLPHHYPQAAAGYACHTAHLITAPVPQPQQPAFPCTRMEVSILMRGSTPRAAGQGISFTRRSAAPTP